MMRERERERGDEWGKALAVEEKRNKDGE